MESNEIARTLARVQQQAGQHFTERMQAVAE